LYPVISEAVAGFAHLYAYSVPKYTLLTTLTGRTIHNLEDVNYPPHETLNLKHWCTLPCHKFPKFACATKTAQSLYDWLIPYLQTKDYVQCPPEMTRRTFDFIAAVSGGRAHLTDLSIYDAYQTQTVVC